MTRPYPYFPSYDGGKETPGIRKLLDLMTKRYGCKSLGTYVVRNMKNGANPPQLSVHATGAALAWYRAPTWDKLPLGDGEFTTDMQVADLDGDGLRDVAVRRACRRDLRAEGRGPGRVRVEEQLIHGARQFSLIGCVSFSPPKSNQNLKRKKTC